MQIFLEYMILIEHLYTKIIAMDIVICRRKWRESQLVCMLIEFDSLKHFYAFFMK